MFPVYLFIFIMTILTLAAFIQIVYHFGYKKGQIDILFKKHQMYGYKLNKVTGEKKIAQLDPIYTRDKNNSTVLIFPGENKYWDHWEIEGQYEKPPYWR